MDDQFDKDLKKRIKEVFDKFEDTSADEGWLLLREKYPPKANRRPVAWLWWGSAAALLLLFLGVLWLNYTPKNNLQLANNKKSENSNLTSKSTGNKTAPGLRDSDVADHPKQMLAGNIRQPLKKLKTREQESVNPSGQPVIAANPIVKNTPVAPENEQSLPVSTPSPIVPENSSSELIAATPGKIQNQNVVSPNPVSLTKIDTGNKTMDKSLAVASAPIINMLEQSSQHDKPVYADNTSQKLKYNKQSPKNFDKTVRFAVFATTYFNYSKGSNSQFNAGAGFSSDISLSNNLKFSTGISIAQNTLNYDSQASTAPIAAAIARATPPQKIDAVAAQNYGIATPSFKNYNASLVGLDIPLNLKYILNPQKGETYVSLGLSSGTFINEAYSYSYNNPAPFSSSITHVQSQSNSQSFNSFYFAKTLNFAFGISAPINKSNKIIIEPFLKYPLDGLGVQQIRFGAGGLNLKFNFSSLRR